MDFVFFHHLLLLYNFNKINSVKNKLMKVFLAHKCIDECGAVCQISDSVVLANS